MPLLFIPWFRLEALRIPIPLLPDPLDELPIQPFGVLVAIGVLLGARYAERWARTHGIHPRAVSDAIAHVLVGGFIAAPTLNIVFYEPEKLADPAALFSSWPGLSSFGGFLGAIVGLLVWRKKRGYSVMLLGDALAVGLPVGWVFGRTGCFVVHDHPGRVTDFFLAVDNYHGMGQPRHDLGFYEVLWTLGCIAVFAALSRRPKRQGFFLALLPLLYTPVRFALDFLRAGPGEGGDPRYFGLTPGQYASLGLGLWGVGLMVWVYRRAPTPLPDSMVWPEPGAADGAKRGSKKGTPRRSTPSRS